MCSFLEDELENIDDDSQIVGSNVYISADDYSSSETYSNESCSSHDDNVTTQLVNAGPVGVAAAAAISSSRYFKKSFHFEFDPALRRRHQTKLLRKIKATMDEYRLKIGQEIAMLCCVPSQRLSLEQQFKIVGSKCMEQALKSQREELMLELDKQLTLSNASTQILANEVDRPLPPLIIDGLPTPIESMTQNQLRNFIPEMLRASTGRSKPGWGKFENCPVWWPIEVPWLNIRTDMRTDKEKAMTSWSSCLREVILSCYRYHNCKNLLPDFNTTDSDHTHNDTNNMIANASEDDIDNFNLSDIRTVNSFTKNCINYLNNIKTQIAGNVIHINNLNNNITKSNNDIVYSNNTIISLNNNTSYDVNNITITDTNNRKNIIQDGIDEITDNDTDKLTNDRPTNISSGEAKVRNCAKKMIKVEPANDLKRKYKSPVKQDLKATEPATKINRLITAGKNVKFASINADASSSTIN